MKGITFNRRTYPAGSKPVVTTRRLPPKVQKTDKGYQLLCPYCIPSHTITPGVRSLCGVTLEIMAVQTVIPTRTIHDKGIHCLKCGKMEGGPMVPYGTGWVHQNDCDPGRPLLSTVPPNSRFARRVFHMKDGRVKTWLEGRFGRPQQVKDIETGEVRSYYFLKV